MKKLWFLDLWPILLILGASAIIGLALGFLTEAIVVGTIVSLGYQSFQLWKFARWLDSGRSVPRHVRGAWKPVYHRIRDMRRGGHERQHRLAAQLDQFRRSAEAMPDATVVLGNNFEILWLNQAAVRLLKLRPKQDLRQPILNLLRSPTLLAYLREGEFDKSVEFLAPGDNHILLSIRVIPYGDENFLLLAQDITERRRMERVRKDFVANVSHELRTPLTVISGFVENLQHDETGFGGKWRRPLRLMRQQTVRMQRIVEDLLLLAQLEGGQKSIAWEFVDVSKMLGEIVEEMKALGDNDIPDITVTTDVSANVEGSLLQLRSAFANLVSNAAKYTPSSGRVELRWFSDDRGGILEVEDTGEGIASEHIPRLTERFYRVDAGRSREKGGTGLGLAIVKHVLQKHSAHLEIESELEKGSCFRCVFPKERLLMDEYQKKEFIEGAS